MLKITRNDLQKKTPAQLSALFNQTLAALPATDPQRSKAQSLLAMIRAEIARRGPELGR